MKNRVRYQARVLSKRQYMSEGFFGISITYYATFEFLNFSRIELIVPSTLIGLLMEGDVGMVTYDPINKKAISFDRPIGVAQKNRP